MGHNERYEISVMIKDNEENKEHGRIVHRTNNVFLSRRLLEHLTVAANAWNRAKVFWTNFNEREDAEL